MDRTGWHRTKWWVACAAAMLLAGCLGGGSDGVSSSSGGSVTGAVVKGPVVDSRVCAFTITNGAKGTQVPLQLAAGSTGSLSGSCYVTPADGSYSFALPPGFTGDLLLEATGGRFCSNESEVSGGACSGGGSLVNLGGAVMSSVVTVPATGAATVYTTPLTTAAVGAAGASLSAASFNAQFNTLAGKVLGAGSVVTPATRPNSTNHPYLTTAASYLQGGGTLTNVVNSLAQGTTNFAAGSGGGATSPATVNAALVGAYNLKFYQGSGQGCGSLCPYAEGQDVPVMVYADGRLSIPGKTLTNPFYRDYGGGPHLPEVIWLDADANIEYALSDNAAGHFNEINVGNAAAAQGNGIPGFLGQLRTPETPASQVLTQIAGTYNFARQYVGADVPWTSVTVGSDGAISFVGGTGTAITSGQVSTVTAYVSCCNRVDVFANVDIDNSGAVDTDDKVSLFLDPDGNLKDVEYYVGPSYVQNNKRGVSVGTHVDTLANPGTGTWAIPSVNSIVGTVNGTAVNASGTTTLSGQPNSGFQLIAQNLNGQTLLQQWVLNVQNPGTGVAVNTNYSCTHGQRTKVVTVQPNSGSTLNTREGGDCNVYITRLEPASGGGNITAIEGRFIVEVYDYSRKTKTVVSDGAFKYEVSPP